MKQLRHIDFSISKQIFFWISCYKNISQTNTTTMEFNQRSPQYWSNFVGTVARRYPLLYRAFFAGHIGIPNQWNCGHVGVPNKSCESWTFFLCIKRFLLFQYICIDAGPVSWKHSIFFQSVYFSSRSSIVSPAFLLQMGNM